MHHQNQGTIYGDNLIKRLKDDIVEMFEHGDHKKGEKMTEDIMEVEMQRIYPDNYALPQVNAIKRYII